MAFKFTLQDVLEHRHTVEGVRLREFAEVNEGVARLRVQRARLEGQIEQARVSIHEDLARGTDRATLQFHENTIGWGHAGIEDVDRRIEEQREEVERRRQALAEAARDRLVLEKLRDREQAGHRKALERAEQQAYDEFALREFYHQRRKEKAA